MSQERSKQATRKSQASVKAREARWSWPVVVYFATGGFGLAGYVVARVILDGRPHPLHWALGLAGAILGYLIGRLWYRWRGDIV